MASRIIAIAITLALWSAAARANSAAMSSITPVQAKLIGDLAARLLQPGSIVHAQVAMEWSGTDCLLRKGAILEGHVLSVVPHSKTIQDSEISVAFTRAQCGQRDMSALDLTLVAVAAPPVRQDLGILDAPLPLGTGGKGGITSLKMAQMGLSLPMAATGLDIPQLAAFKVGDVVGINRLKLSIRIGRESGSVLKMKGRDVSLEAHTMLLFVPTQSMLSLDPGAGRSKDVAPAHKRQWGRYSSSCPRVASASRRRHRPLHTCRMQRDTLLRQRNRCRQGRGQHFHPSVGLHPASQSGHGQS